MNTKKYGFSELLDRYIAGELDGEEIKELEEQASLNRELFSKLEEAGKLKALLTDTGQTYRDGSYPGDLAADVKVRIHERSARLTLRPAWSVALATVIILACLITISIRQQSDREIRRSGSFVTAYSNAGRALSEARKNSGPLTASLSMIPAMPTSDISIRRILNGERPERPDIAEIENKLRTIRKGEPK